MLHAPFLLRAGVVHVYVKVFVSTLEALLLRQDPLSSVITTGNTW
jgi:hypothetical protein